MLNETILIIIDNDKMFPKISVLIRKNSHEVMKVITNNYKKLQSDSRYCQYNNEGTDEMILPLLLRYCELLW
jgi:CRISPR/Cas system-associated endonuclease/helicase Cas3